MRSPAMIGLDLKFRVLSPRHRIFLVFPGEGYFLYEKFISLQRIFPQLPALDLIPGRLVEAQPDHEKKVTRSRRIANWYRSGKRSDRPSRSLSDYGTVKRTRSLSQTTGVLAGFFDRAEKGDIVIVPGRSVFEKVLIGELLDQPTEFREITVPELWEDEKVPSRRVNWLAFPERGECSLQLQRRFPSPNAFRELEQSLWPEVHAMAYASYSIQDRFTSRFDVTSPDFSTKDDYYLQQIFNLVASISEQISKTHYDGAIAIDLTTKQIDEIIELLTDNTYVPTLTVNINSPGSLIFSCAKVVQLVVAGLLALTTLDADTVWNAVEAQEVKVENTEAPTNDPCTANVGLEVLEQIRMMGYDRWQEMCKKIKALRMNNGLQGKSRATKK